MPNIIKGIVSGIIVSIVLFSAKHGREETAGLLVLFPAITFLSYYFIGQSQGSESLQKVVASSLLAAPTWIITIGAILLVLPHVDYRIAILVGLAAWCVSALVYFLLRS